MDKDLNIYIDHLKQGKVEKISLCVPPDFLEINDPELSFSEKVIIGGEVYITDDGLVIHLNVQTAGEIPCRICNGPVNIPVRVKGLYHVEPVKDIRAGIFNMGSLIRESILLEMPSFAECAEGNCPERQVIEKYLTKKEPSQNIEEEEGYKPFSNLE